MTLIPVLILQMIPEPVRFLLTTFLTPVTADHLPLLVSEVIARDLPQTFYIDKKRVCIHQITVDIIEIRYEHIAPKHEFVKVGVSIRHLAIFIVKREQLIIAISFGKLRKRRHEIRDVGHFGKYASGS